MGETPQYKFIKRESPTTPLTLFIIPNKQIQWETMI